MLNKILTFLLIISIIGYSQSKLSLQPSGYFTYGNYSDGTSANQYTFFLSVTPNNLDYLVTGIEHIDLSNDLWNYSQNNFALGLHYWLTNHNLKIKTDLMFIDGKYKSSDNTFKYGDNGYLISPEILSGVYPFYYGFGYAFFSQSGGNKINSNQFYLNLYYYPTYKFLINLIPSFHLISKNENYTSLNSSLTYFYSYKLWFNASFALGSKKFFYHPDLMVFFNQLETQKGNFSFRANYNFYKNLVASFVYQKSKFVTFEIDYFVFGISSKFSL